MAADTHPTAMPTTGLPAAAPTVIDTDDESAIFQADLIAHGLILPNEVKGGYGRGPVFEDILEHLDALILASAADEKPEQMTFPPIIARTMVERMGYLETFPHLIGSVHSFFGSDAVARQMAERAAAGERWEEPLQATEVMLLPASCYPVYPLFSGLLPGQGRTVTVRNWVYRHEPSDEPTRLQSFRMREFIRAGSPDVVEAWRDAWLARGLELLGSLGLPVRSDVANDPFFGRAGRVLASKQREQRLKFEIVVPVISRRKPTAIWSCNWHQEHFTSVFGIRQADSSPAHTACLGIGLERIVLALLKTHGMTPANWPADVRTRLWG